MEVIDMTLQLINSHEAMEYFQRVAAQHSAQRYVCFTKKWLCNEFVFMTDSDSKQEVMEFFFDQSTICRQESPRLVYDQLERTVIACHNEELVLSTMELLRGRIDRRPYLFKFPNNSWSLENYIARENDRTICSN